MRVYRVTIWSLTAVLLMLATAPTASAQTSWTAGVGLCTDAGNWITFGRLRAAAS